VTTPAPDPSNVGAYSDYLIKGLFAASDAFLAETERQREERRNRPEARARRSAGSRKGWDTRRTREAAEDAEESALFE
jgi:allantoicase